MSLEPSPISREELIDRLRVAAAETTRARTTRRWPRAVAALRGAFKRALSTLRCSPTAADEIAKIEAAIGDLTNKAPADPGDRWSLARVLVDLERLGIKSWRIARALIGLGYCAGDGSPGDVRRCLARMRKEKQRLRDQDSRRSRRSSSPPSRPCCGSLPSPRAARSAQENQMAKKQLVRKTTTTTIEELVDKKPTLDEDNADDELEDEEVEEDDQEIDDDPPKPMRRRR